MKFGMVNGRKTHAKDVLSGTIGKDIWFTSYDVKACVGRYLQYWVYVNEKPVLPKGYEPESEWHANWKELVLEDYTEVVCGEKKEHRADILTETHVIEIQKSRIDIRDAEERVRFYRALKPESRVIWIIDVRTAWSEDRLKKGEYIKDKKNQFKLIWAKPFRHQWIVDLARDLDTHVFLEFNDKNQYLIKCWVNNKGELSGSWKKKTDFFVEFLQKYSSLEPDDIGKILGFA